MDLTPERLKSDTFVLDAHQKDIIRLRLKLEAEKLLGIPYKMAKTEEEKNASVGKWIDLTKLPVNLDCSGLTNGVYRKVGMKLPHGSRNQFNFTVATNNPQHGDLGFFGDDGDINRVTHVGMLYDPDFFIEARGFQKNANFETGKVILRHRKFWEAYKPHFLGYRAHAKLL